MTDWRALAALADNAVDDTFGEEIVLIPWIRGTYKEGGADPAREIRHTVGVYVNPTVMVKSVSEGAGGVRVAQSEMLFSLKEENVAGFQQYDMVQLPERHITGEISYIEPGDTGRSMIHLNRTKATQTVARGVLTTKPVLPTPALVIN